LSAIISINNLGYAYPALTPEEQPEWVLRDISLEVEAGEFLSIMGPTGVGKTTLCLALNGIVPQSTGGVIRGEVIVDGLNTKRRPVAELARRVGMVFQDPETQLFNMTVEAELAFGLENLGLPPDEIRERIKWALALVKMDEFQSSSPFHLSGGQKQRVAIASALAMTPKILVLDEPTANLDPLGKREVFSVVRELRRQQGMTIVMVEHESERIAQFSDRVVVLNEGQVALMGPPGQVFSQVERMAAIGLAIPQVSEVAHRLNGQHGTDFTFTQLDEAALALASVLRGAG
jgi:energy-coupling factor transporter ATPase